MYIFVSLLAFVLWLVIAFFVLRFFFGKYFHEPRRAEIAALAAAVAFAVGSAWPFSLRAGVGTVPGAPPGAAPSSATAGPLVASTPHAAPAKPPRDVSALCRSAKAPGGQAKPKAAANPNGSVNPVASTEHPDTNVADGGQMKRGEHYRVQGWAIAPEGDRAALGVCLLIDGRIDGRSRVLYGFARPDVSAAFKRPEVSLSGFEIDVPAGDFPPGPHRLQVATMMGRGEMRVLSDARNVTIY